MATKSFSVAQVMDIIGLFNHAVRDVAGPRDLSYFFQGL